MNPKIPAMADQIEVWPVEKLHPYARNARTHSDEQISQIAASMIEFGVTTPLLVDTGAGIIAGHGRLEAAKLIDLKELPVIVLDHLSEEQKRAYVIADNKLAENAGWDYSRLSQEIEALMADNFDVGITGFSDDEISELLSEAGDDLTEGFDGDDEEREIKESDTICVVGSYRIPISREDYLRWHDDIREKVGFEKDAIRKEIRKRLKI
jgi:ParB-like chromosome segregation protein Spo0J